MKYNTEVRFPYAIKWNQSFASYGKDSQKTTILYCPECQKEMYAAYKKFDKEWQKSAQTNRAQYYV